MRYTADQLPALLDDMDSALLEMTAPFRRDAALWTRPAGKWTAGQHAEHIAKTLALTAAELGESERRMRTRELPPVPWRGPLQALAVRLLTSEGFPRGGKAPPSVAPGGAPDAAAVLGAIDEGGRRHRDLANRLSAEERARLWFRNPFVPLRWHYTLAEIVRVHATHTRHHMRIVNEGYPAPKG